MGTENNRNSETIREQDSTPEATDSSGAADVVGAAAAAARTEAARVAAHRKEAQRRLGLHAAHEPAHVPIDMKPRARRAKAPLPGISDPRVKRARGERKPGPLRRSIKLDAVHPEDFRKIDCHFFCDDCSHYSPTHKVCTIGFVPQHTREEQMKIYNLTGKIALCRFIEID